MQRKPMPGLYFVFFMLYGLILLGQIGLQLSRFLYLVADQSGGMLEQLNNIGSGLMIAMVFIPFIGMFVFLILEPLVLALSILYLIRAFQFKLSNLHKGIAIYFTLVSVVRFFGYAAVSPFAGFGVQAAMILSCIWLVLHLVILILLIKAFVRQTVLEVESKRKQTVLIVVLVFLLSFVGKSFVMNTRSSLSGTSQVSSGKVDASVLWHQQLTGRVQNSPVLGDGVVYAYTNDRHRKEWNEMGNGTVLGFDTNTGEKKFEVTLTDKEVGGVVVAGQSVIIESVTAHPGQSKQYTVAAYNLSGQLAWESPQTLKSLGDLASSETVVYALDGESIRAMDVKTGKQLWQFLPTDTSNDGFVTVMTDGQTVYGIKRLGGLYAINAQTGAERWKLLTLKGPELSWRLKINGENLLIDRLGAATFAGENLTVVNKNSGDVMWRSAVPGKLISIGDDGHLVIASNVMQWDGPATFYEVDGSNGQKISEFTTPVNDVGYVNANNGVGYYTSKLNFVAVDLRSGEQLWRKTLNSTMQSDTWIFDDAIFFPVSNGLDGEISLLDGKTGQEKQKVKIGGFTRVEPVEDATKLYFLSEATLARDTYTTQEFGQTVSVDAPVEGGYIYAIEK